MQFHIFRVNFKSGILSKILIIFQHYTNTTIMSIITSHIYEEKNTSDQLKNFQETERDEREIC